MSKSLIGFVFKLLDGDGRGLLNEFVPTLQEHPHRSNKIPIGTLLLKEKIRFVDTSNQYNRSIEGQVQAVWNKLPQELLKVGKADGWQTVTKQCQRFLTGKNVKSTKES